MASTSATNRRAYADLTVARLPSGHWLPRERTAEHIETIRSWLASSGLLTSARSGSA